MSRERRHGMIKIFQGDYQSVQRDVNNWIEVYSPEILDFKQSMCSMEHNIIVLLTFSYKKKAGPDKVQYRMNQ
jgi:hypothetical protein